MANGGSWEEIREYDVYMKRNKIMVRIHGWECEIQKNRGKHSSNLVQGVLAGFFKTFLEIDLIIKEKNVLQ